MLYKTTKLYFTTLKRVFRELAVPSYTPKFQHLEWVQLFEKSFEFTKKLSKLSLDIAFNNFTISSCNAKSNT